MNTNLAAGDLGLLPVTGKSFPATAFPVVELDRLDGQAVLDVLDGRHAGAIFRGAVPPDDCRKIAANFWTHPARYTRRAVAPAEYVGAFHFGKPLDAYLAEAAAVDGTLDRLFDGCGNPQRAFVGDLNRVLNDRGRGGLRVAEHDSRTAARFVMRSWTNRKQFSLLPHEDEAQCRCANQAGFEIQRAADNPLVAVNVCVENTGGGGLRIWNVIPDEASRRRLGLTDTGSPYPLETLAGHESQLIDIRPGDLYCFNGKAVHAVEAMTGETNRRATIAFLMARLDPATVVYWA